MTLMAKALEKHLDLMRELESLQRENRNLRDDAKIARELMNRYVRPDMRHQAEEWLKSKQL